MPSKPKADRKTGADTAPAEMPKEPIVADPIDETPLDYMLRVMRDSKAGSVRRDAMARSLLPYMHARIPGRTDEPDDEEDGPITFTWHPEQG